MSETHKTKDDGRRQAEPGPTTALLLIDVINDLAFDGGEALLLRTLEESFGVSIEHTVTAHFPTQVTAVDLLGGVEAAGSRRGEPVYLAPADNAVAAPHPGERTGLGK